MFQAIVPFLKAHIFSSLFLNTCLLIAVLIKTTFKNLKIRPKGIIHISVSLSVSD